MKFNPPRTVPSAEIQAELYARLRAAGIECHLEYRQQGAAGIRRRSLCVFDIVVVKDGEIAAIVECKRTPTRPPNESSLQARAYEQFGVPLV